MSSSSSSVMRMKKSFRLSAKKFLSAGISFFFRRWNDSRIFASIGSIRGFRSFDSRLWVLSWVKRDSVVFCKSLSS